MPRLILGILLVLAACAQPAPNTASRFRDVAAPIYSNAVFEPARMTGRWVQVAAFATTATPGCKPGGAEISVQDGALTIAMRLCLNGKEVAFSGPMPAAGPGRFAVGGQEWWVIWVDTGYRSLAIGTPSGAFGFILNRDADLPGDRLTAAREVFDFNGYGVGQLRAFR